MDSKTHNTILKLNKLTKENSVVWETSRTQPNSLAGTERLIGNTYITLVGVKRFRVYKFEERYYHDEEVFDWVPRFRLEFIDESGKGEWTFPDDHGTGDLYDSILYKISGADDFFDDFLKE